MKTTIKISREIVSYVEDTYEICFPENVKTDEEKFDFINNLDEETLEKDFVSRMDSYDEDEGDETGKYKIFLGDDYSKCKEFNSEVNPPLDLFVDMTITLDKLKDKFNCNDGQLDDCELDWSYFHKLARRSKFFTDSLGIVFNDKLK